MPDMLRTDRTYASRKNALEALSRAFVKADVSAEDSAQIPYVIAVDAEGRYAPVVFQRHGWHLLPLIHHGVTVIG